MWSAETGAWSLKFGIFIPKTELDGARPPRASRDAPRVPPCGARSFPLGAERFGPLEVFREGVENCARGGRAPRLIVFMRTSVK